MDRVIEDSRAEARRKAKRYVVVVCTVSFIYGLRNALTDGAAAEVKQQWVATCMAVVPLALVIVTAGAHLLESRGWAGGPCGDHQPCLVVYSTMLILMCATGHVLRGGFSGSGSSLLYGMLGPLLCIFAEARSKNAISCLYAVCTVIAVVISGLTRSDFYLSHSESQNAASAIVAYIMVASVIADMLTSMRNMKEKAMRDNEELVRSFYPPPVAQSMICGLGSGKASGDAQRHVHMFHKDVCVLTVAIDGGPENPSQKHIALGEFFECLHDLADHYRATLLHIDSSAAWFAFGAMEAYGDKKDAEDKFERAIGFAACVCDIDVCELTSKVSMARGDVVSGVASTSMRTLTVTGPPVSLAKQMLSGLPDYSAALNDAFFGALVREDIPEGFEMERGETFWTLSRAPVQISTAA